MGREELRERLRGMAGQAGDEVRDDVELAGLDREVGGDPSLDLVVRRTVARARGVGLLLRLVLVGDPAADGLREAVRGPREGVRVRARDLIGLSFVSAAR